jgi:ATP adenylyltransferase
MGRMTSTGGGRQGPDIMWATWRMAYIAGEHDDGPADPPCVFCHLPARGDDARSLILHRGERCFVIMNLYPYNNGHLMVVPYAHLDSLTALDADTTGEMMELAKLAQRVVAEAMRPQGFNLGINQGRAAGAGIADHVHMHLLPRWAGDTNFMTTLGDTRVMPQHIDDTYRLLLPGFSA